MTEEDAKTKWCPFSRVALGWSQDTARRGSGQELAATVNRGDNLSGHTECIGSACMAWRWEYRTWHVVRERFIEEGESYLSTDKTENRQVGGYCGLAGKP